MYKYTPGQVNIPPAFRFPAATKRGGAQPSVAKGVVLTWNNVTLPAKRRHQVFKVQLKTLGCAVATQSINATLISALHGCTSSATKTVRAKFTKTSPSPTDCLQPGCEPKGELVVGVNNLQMTTTGIVLATDSATCVSYPPYLMYYTAVRCASSLNSHLHSR